MNEVKLPNLTRFDHLFTEFENRGKSDPRNNRYHISIGGPGYDGYDYGSCRPTGVVRDYIENNMLDVEDLGCNFEVIVREDDAVLVVAKYDQILGSHWLSFIDRDSLPEVN